MLHESNGEVQGTWISEHPIRATGSGKSTFIRYHSPWIEASYPSIVSRPGNRWHFSPKGSSTEYTLYLVGIMVLGYWLDQKGNATSVVLVGYNQHQDVMLTMKRISDVIWGLGTPPKTMGRTE